MKMYEGFDIWAFLAGLPTGLLICGIVFYFVRKKNMKERVYDERYKNLHRHAKSISWHVTAVAIFIAWLITMIVEGPKLAFFLLTFLWVTHMISWIIGAAVASKHH